MLQGENERNGGRNTLKCNGGLVIFVSNYPSAIKIKIILQKGGKKRENQAEMEFAGLVIIYLFFLLNISAFPET